LHHAAENFRTSAPTSGRHLETLAALQHCPAQASVLRGDGHHGFPVATSRWAVQLAARVGYWKAVVAIAAKNARLCWAVLQRGESFTMPA
jgi:hypothetical protein